MTVKDTTVIINNYCTECGRTVNAIGELEEHFLATGHSLYRLRIAGTMNWKGMYGSTVEQPES